MSRHTSIEDTLPYQVMEIKKRLYESKSFEGGDFISFQKEFIWCMMAQVRGASER